MLSSQLGCDREPGQDSPWKVHKVLNVHIGKITYLAIL